MSHDKTAPFSRFPRLLISVVGIGIAAGAFVGLPACGDDDPTAPPDKVPPLTVQVRDNAFNPQTLAITVGDSVTWQWVGSTSHTVTHGTSPSNLGGLFDTPAKSSGTFGYRFNAPGSVPYFCRLHYPGMTGTITVTTP
jgi:plastocyanin